MEQRTVSDSRLEGLQTALPELVEREFGRRPSLVQIDFEPGLVICLLGGISDPVGFATRRQPGPAGELREVHFMLHDGLATDVRGLIEEALGTRVVSFLGDYDAGRELMSLVGVLGDHDFRPKQTSGDSPFEARR